MSFSIAEATKLVSSRVEVPELFPGAKGTPPQDYFTVQLGIKMVDLIEERARGGRIHEDEVDGLVKDTQELFYKEYEKTIGGTE